MAEETSETIHKLKFERLPHPAHSPDLAPSDYHSFRQLKENYMDADLQIMKKSRTWCIHVPPPPPQKNFSQKVKKKLYKIEMKRIYIKKK